MKYLVAFLILAGSVLAGEHEIILFGEQSIEAGQTNTVETTYQVTGMFRQIGIWRTSTIGGSATTTAYSVRNDLLNTLGFQGTSTQIVTKGTGSGSTSTIPLYDETIRIVTINYSTNMITLSPAIFYEK